MAVPDRPAGDWADGWKSRGQVQFEIPEDVGELYRASRGLVANVIIADKGDDADHLCDRIAESGGQRVATRYGELLAYSGASSNAAIAIWLK